ncbi:zinc-binding dehydrogenase [uncultured Roseobacter sp.]|uniref:zinc-binding dehydrogenase n=1 Tax=uncultured Roseobacter sp. TaxID=114847 RepID=UPI00260DA3ED|nr:zinc-binding dehydrogenase [uncultured Roseobacter sp.]
MVTIRESTVIDAPAIDVWRLLRDFNAHERWHPAIATSFIEGGGAPDVVGAVRNFRLTDGGLLREQLIDASDLDMRLSYCLLEAPVPLHNYVAHMRLRRVTDGDACFVEWWSRFDPPAAEITKMTELVRDGVYRAGFRALQDWFGGGPQNAPAVPSVLSTMPGPLPASSLDEKGTGIFVQAFGGPENLVERPIEIPRPGPREVLLSQTYVGVNFIDIHTRTGHFNLIQPPSIPGMEAVGKVALLGAEVQGLSLGDRVGYACAPPGAYCSHRIMPSEALVTLPDTLSDAQAAASLLRGVTTNILTTDVHRLKVDETVIVHAAAGGLGQLLVQVCVARGAHVIATAGSAQGRDMALALGAAAAVDYRSSDCIGEIMDLTRGRGADVVFDGVGAETFETSLTVVAIRGHVISFGEASGDIGSWDIGSFSSKSLRISRPNYGHFADSFVENARSFFDMVAAGDVRIPNPKTYPLSDAKQAHDDLENNRYSGASVLEV